MTRQFLTAVLVALICVRAQANTANFNALPAGASYVAPTLFSNGGLDFDVLFNLGNLNVTAASGLVNPSFTGNYLDLTMNVGLNVNLPTGASQIQFDFIQNSDSSGIVVNGGLLNVNQIPAITNGVSVVHLVGSKTNPWGSITANGNINTFMIVGTGFLVDNLNATLVAGLSGDYNKNQVVDAGDYALWRKTLNSPSGYNSWRANFGTPGASGTGFASAGIPEPSTLAMLLVCLQCVAIPRRAGRLRRLAR
jgi:hypothetical protein